MQDDVSPMTNRNHSVSATQVLITLRFLASGSFNRALRITRSIIERTFGILKRRFHILHSEVRMTPERVCTITIACCILHNIAIDNNEPLPEYEDEEPFEDVNFVGVETGQVVRNHLHTYIHRLYLKHGKPSVILHNKYSLNYCKLKKIYEFTQYTYKI